jgi:hypothetical protein
VPYELITLQVAGVQIGMLIDLGAQVNIVSKVVYEIMKKIKCIKNKIKKQLSNFG